MVVVLCGCTRKLYGGAVWCGGGGDVLSGDGGSGGVSFVLKYVLSSQ